MPAGQLEHDEAPQPLIEFAPHVEQPPAPAPEKYPGEQATHVPPSTLDVPGAQLWQALNEVDAAGLDVPAAQFRQYELSGLLTFGLYVPGQQGEQLGGLP